VRSRIPTGSPSLWTRADFPDEAAWSFDLSRADRQALIASCRGGASQDLAGQFSGAAARWMDPLSNGPGFLRLRNFPVDSLTDLRSSHGDRHGATSRATTHWRIPTVLPVNVK
jgi:hypothetical protein